MEKGPIKPNWRGVPYDSRCTVETSESKTSLRKVSGFQFRIHFSRNVGRRRLAFAGVGLGVK